MTNEQLERFQSEVTAMVMEEDGVECLLPQNMPDEWLYLLAEESEAFNEGSENRDFAGTLFCVIQILNYQGRHVPDGNGGGGPSVEELCEHSFAYAMCLSFERISRRTNIKISPPTLEDIFDMDKARQMWVNSNINAGLN